MAFKIRKPAFRPWPVTVKLPACGADGQVVEIPQTFIGHFTTFSEADYTAIERELFGDKDAQRERVLSPREQAELEAQLVFRLLTGWEGIFADDDAPLPFSAPALAELFTGPDGPLLRRAFGQSIFELRFGLAPAKNVATSPLPGLTPAPGEAAAPTK